AVLTRTFDFGFATGLSYKDVKLCVHEAENLGVPMVAGSAVLQMLAITQARFGAESDFTSIARVVEEWAGVEIKPNAQRRDRRSRPPRSAASRPSGPPRAEPATPVDTPQLIENFLQSLTAGVLTGTIYGLLCVGLTLIFGVMRVINFAQGDFMMLGMYFAFYCFGAIGGQIVFGDVIGPFVAALLAGPAVFLAGLVAHRALIARVTGTGAAALEAEGHYAQLILTLGLSLVLQNAG